MDLPNKVSVGAILNKSLYNGTEVSELRDTGA